jgi:hypothetical protein
LNIIDIFIVIVIIDCFFNLISIHLLLVVNYHLLFFHILLKIILIFIHDLTVMIYNFVILLISHNLISINLFEVLKLLSVINLSVFHIFKLYHFVILIKTNFLMCQLIYPSWYSLLFFHFISIDLVYVDSILIIHICINNFIYILNIISHIIFLYD